MLLLLLLFYTFVAFALLLLLKFCFLDIEHVSYYAVAHLRPLCTIHTYDTQEMGSPEINLCSHLFAIIYGNGAPGLGSCAAATVLYWMMKPR